MRLLDLVCPANVVAGGLISEVIRLGAADVDLVLYGGGPKILSGLKSNWSFRRRLVGPQSYLLARNNNGAALAEAADFVLADGDSAI